MSFLGRLTVITSIILTMLLVHGVSAQMGAGYPPMASQYPPMGDDYPPMGQRRGGTPSLGGGRFGGMDRNSEAFRLYFEVKADFIYKFAKFVEWPLDKFEDENSPLSICILGFDPFGEIMEQTLAGKTAQGRILTVTNIWDLESIEPCHMLFISMSENYHIQDVLDAANDDSVLTISDIPRFMLRGGMISFLSPEGGTNFAINLASVRDAGLDMSSQLLKLALFVNDGSDAFPALEW